MRGIQSGHTDLMQIRDSLKEGWLNEIALSAKNAKPLFQTLSISLGLGEASSLAAAKTRGFCFACDDKTARREAGLLDVKLTGTLGILKKSVQNKIIKLQDGDIILAEMIFKGFFSSINSLRDF